ncbi:hypothetical protein B296_00017032 [Ensete ventricosum]|uniref:Uncharacterized protein n=1 Tax=Ensete ventricosum TaxID=4639 RepID=A0A427AWC7_ENSVE|nr:hypothetical protein B296_00017032 [Ensete ventricosum]
MSSLAFFGHQGRPQRLQQESHSSASPWEQSPSCLPMWFSRPSEPSITTRTARMANYGKTSTCLKKSGSRPTYENSYTRGSWPDSTIT